jgi:hypothetical protein
VNDDATNIHTVEGPFDMASVSKKTIDKLTLYHQTLCGCAQMSLCIVVYRRCMINNQCYHSLLYTKRQSTVSYFVSYIDDHGRVSFGSIELYFTCGGKAFALIDHHPVRYPFSDNFLSTSYYPLLSNLIDVFFHVLEPKSSTFHCVPTGNVSNFCIVFEGDQSLIVTPVSTAFEHD